MRRFLLLLPALAVLACSSRPALEAPVDAGHPPAEDAGEPDGVPVVTAQLPPACAGPLAPTGAGLRFTDESAAWELDAAHLDVVGTQLEALDLDQDGYPDLLVHQYTTVRGDPSLPGAQQLVRVLMNRPRASGTGRRFVDATLASGYGAIRADATPANGKLRSAQLAIGGDVDNDGVLDVFTGSYQGFVARKDDHGDRNEILLGSKTARGTFTLAAKSDVQVIPEGDPLLPTSTATFTDVDRDGVLDLFVAYWFRGQGSYGVQARLYRGNGDGTFKDATVGSGLETTLGRYADGDTHRPAYGVTSCDLDGDHKPELLVSVYGRQWSLLYRNTTLPGGPPRFLELGAKSGFRGDENLDYTDAWAFRCDCKASGGTSSPLCAKAAPPPAGIDCAGLSNFPRETQPWELNGNMYTSVCADFDGDGRLDLYNSTIQHLWAGQSSDPSELLLNDGGNSTSAVRFRRPGRKASGLEWRHDDVPDNWNEGGIRAAAADLDLDGQEEIIVAASEYAGNYSQLFRNRRGAQGTFEEIGARVGLHFPCANGLAIADFDRDGDLDVVIGAGTANDCSAISGGRSDVHFFQNAINDGAGRRGFLQIGLEGKGRGFSNRLGFGAQVRVTVDGVTQLKELQGGYGTFGVQHDTVLTFGLGASCMPDKIEVRWPDSAGTLVRYRGVGGGRRVILKEEGSVVDAPPLGP